MTMSSNPDLDDLRRELERPLPYPEADGLKGHAHEVIAWLLQYFQDPQGEAAGKTGSRAELEALLAAPPPEEGAGFGQAFADFRERVAPYAFRLAHPRFLAYIPAAPTFASILGDLLCSGTNFFCGTWLAGSGPAEVELIVLDWFRHLLGLPESARGILTSGGDRKSTRLNSSHANISYAV